MIVVCKLPNASGSISGVEFTRREDGHMATADVAADVAAIFDGIPGYEVEDAEAAKRAAEAEAAARASVDACAALRREADEAGVKIDGRLKNPDALRAALDAAKAEKAKSSQG